MKTPLEVSRYRMMLALALCAGMPWGATMAADRGGCFHSSNANYQIGQTAEIVVTNDMAEGTVVRDEKAHGDGQVLATCMDGLATFEGDYTVPRINALVPLTVGGRRSGFGLELYLVERLDGREFDFPHRYERLFQKGDVVRSNEADVGYRIRRMTGPVEYGAVDQRKVAEQWSYQPDGARTEAFRHMVIYELKFVRPTCSIETDSLNQEVALGDYNVGNFATPDRATPWVAFHMTVAECQEPVGLVTTFTFGTAADRDPDNGQLFSLQGSDAAEPRGQATRPRVPRIIADVPGFGRHVENRGW